MPDAYYNDTPNSFLGNPVHNRVDLDTDDIRCFLYDEGTDALNLADEDVADVIAGARVAESTDLGSKTVGVVGDGIFDHANFVFVGVTGAEVDSITYWGFNATESIAPLLWNLDSATGLPVLPNGGDITWAPAGGGVIDVS